MTMVLPKRGEKGFTLIELMIVIAIIGILAAIAIPQFSNYRKRAADAAALSDAKNLATAQEVYHTDYFTYTATVANLTPAGFQGASKDVVIAITAATANGFTATVSHPGGAKNFTVTGPGGTITEANK